MLHLQIQNSFVHQPRYFIFFITSFHDYGKLGKLKKKTATRETEAIQETQETEELGVGALDAKLTELEYGM